MSQYGMQLPGGQLRRGASMNVYTGLLFLSVVALAAACVFVYLNAAKVGKNGQPLELQEKGRIALNQDK
jgi:hypothetical protein